MLSNCKCITTNCSKTNKQNIDENISQFWKNRHLIKPQERFDKLNIYWYIKIITSAIWFSVNSEVVIMCDRSKKQLGFVPNCSKNLVNVSTREPKFKQNKNIYIHYTNIQKSQSKS